MTSNRREFIAGVGASLPAREDAEAYLARLEAYAGHLHGETARLAAAAAQGVIAPDFILDRTLAQLELARGGNVADWPMIASFARKTKDIPGNWARQSVASASSRW